MEQAQQFDIFRRTNGTFVVVLQDNVLDHLPGRVVAPIIWATGKGIPITGLNPLISVDGKAGFIGVQYLTAALQKELGKRTGNCSHLRDELTRAVDLLFTGV